MDGGSPKKYTHLFTIYGEPIINILQIEADVQFLVASTTGKFKGLKINELFNNDEPSKTIMNRMCRESPTKIDCTSSFANRNTSNVSSKEELATMRQSRVKDPSLDATFKLTSVTTIKPAMPQTVRNVQRQGKLSSQQIREASKRDLKTAKRSMALDALIRIKQRKSQSFSSTQANSGLRRQKLE